jgi:hypothetical protein
MLSIIRLQLSIIRFILDMSIMLGLSAPPCIICAREEGAGLLCASAAPAPMAVASNAAAAIEIDFVVIEKLLFLGAHCALASGLPVHGDKPGSGLPEGDPGLASLPVVEVPWPFMHITIIAAQGSE